MWNWLNYLHGLDLVDYDFWLFLNDFRIPVEARFIRWSSSWFWFFFRDQIAFYWLWNNSIVKKCVYEKVPVSVLNAMSLLIDRFDRCAWPQCGWTCLKCVNSESLNWQLNPHKWHLNGYVMVFLSMRPKRWYETTSLGRITVVVGSICTFAIVIVPPPPPPTTTSLTTVELFPKFCALSPVVIILKCLVMSPDGCGFFRGISTADSIIIVLYSIISARKHDNEKKKMVLNLKRINHYFGFVNILLKIFKAICTDLNT